MPYTKQTLQHLYALSIEDVNATLNACGLTIDRNEYSDEEIQLGFDVICEYFNSGIASDYTRAAELFKKQQVAKEQSGALSQTTTKKTGKSKRPTNENVALSDNLDISELLNRATEKCGMRIKLSVATDILVACGLPDREEYTQEECARFLEACDLLNQGRTSEEIAAHFGTGDGTANSLDTIVEIVGGAALIAESGLERLVDKVTDRQTDNIPGLVNRSFLKHAAHKLAQNKENTDLFFAELEERVMAQIEGKRQARSLPATWDSEPNSLPLSSPKRMSLPEGSENPTSAE